MSFTWGEKLIFGPPVVPVIIGNEIRGQWLTLWKDFIKEHGVIRFAF